MFNPAAQHPDGASRQAFADLFRAMTGPKVFGTFRVEEIRDAATGQEILVIRQRKSGRLRTIAALEPDGTVHAKAFLVCNDFNAKGWDKAE